jgi:hypothetical protein
VRKHLRSVQAQLNQRTFYNEKDQVTSRAATSGDTTTSCDTMGRTTGRATTTRTGTTFYNEKGQNTGRIIFKTREDMK